MTCPECRADPRPAYSEPRKCAFDDAGLFTGNNWSCATMHFLRRMVRNQAAAEEFGCSLCQSNDSSVGVIPIPDWNRDECGFVVLSWHKNRGRTGTALVVSEDLVNPLTLGCATALVEFYRDGVVQ